MRLLIAALVLAASSLAFAQQGPLPDPERARGCRDWIPGDCPAPMDPLSPVSFNTAELVPFRGAAVPPWRNPFAPRSATPRLLYLHALAQRGLKPALPHWLQRPGQPENRWAHLATPRRYEARLPSLHTPDAERWAAVVESTTLGEDCPCLFAPGSGPGQVPDGLLIGRNGADLELSWNASCSANASDYSIHEGTLGNWYSHTMKQCSTGGATTSTITPAAGSRYYLIVPLNTVAEGSYGADSSGAPRAISTATCRAAVLAEACP